MDYDPTEMFRVDPGEMELNDQFQAEVELERQAEEAMAAQAASIESGTLTSTEGQSRQAQQPKPSTGGKKREQQFPWEQGYDIGDYARQVVEGGSAPVMGALDFGVDLINKVTGQKFRNT